MYSRSFTFICGYFQFNPPCAGEALSQENPYLPFSQALIQIGGEKGPGDEGDFLLSLSVGSAFGGAAAQRGWALEPPRRAAAQNRSPGSPARTSAAACLQTAGPLRSPHIRVRRTRSH